MRFVPALPVLLLSLTQSSFAPNVPQQRVIRNAGTPGAEGVRAGECKFDRPQVPAAVPNDNRSPGGSIAGNVLRLNLSVRNAGWYPEGASACGLATPAFAEDGKTPQIPAPLIRVRAGTELHVIVRNELTTAIRVAGLHDHGDESPDTTMVAAGEASSIRFRVTVPGTYFYRALVHPAPTPGSADPNTQLVGAFVVDPIGTLTDDRILIITRWRKFIPNPEARVGEPGALGSQRILSAVNGLSWPNTERLQASVGDTVRWRVINADAVVTHPMHLHGFYFRVTAFGDMQRDTLYATTQQRMAVTEWMPPWRTMSLEWSPDREGNWLFHCHMVAHMSPNQRLDRILGGTTGGSSGLAPQSGADHAAHTVHSHEMAGLIVGISVGSRAMVDASRAATPPIDRTRRKLRLLAQKKAKVFGDSSGYGFVLQEGTQSPAADSIRIPGSELALTLGEPAEITVVNRAALPISVHWHGIELESYFDGVAGWSGDTRRLAPAIAAGDSFVVHITPPRAGTFIYHVHDERGTELAAGMYGPLIVRERGADVSGERTFVIADAGPGRGGAAATFVNGTLSPDTVALVAGRSYRFRLIGITANGARRVSFARKDGPYPWRLVARDGWELGSKEQQSLVPFRIGPGITADYEVTPEAGDYVLEVGVPAQGVRPATFTLVPIRVRPSQQGS